MSKKAIKRVAKKRVVKKVAKKTVKKACSRFIHKSYAISYRMCPIHRIRYPKGAYCPRCGE